MSQNNTFRTTPIPHRTKFGEPMTYYTLSDDGKIHTETSRAACLARSEEPENSFPQRWYVDEESGLVVRLPRNQMGERDHRGQTYTIDKMINFRNHSVYNNRPGKTSAGADLNNSRRRKYHDLFDIYYLIRRCDKK